MEVRRGRNVLGTDASARSFVYPRTCAEDVRNEWATRRIGITGPAPSDLPDSSPLLPGEGPGVKAGSSVAARIVDCNPRRYAAASVQDFAASMPATRGLIAAPWTPASHLPCSRGGRQVCAPDCEFTLGSVQRCVTDWKKCAECGLTSPRLHSRQSSPAAAAGETLNFGNQNAAAVGCSGLFADAAHAEGGAMWRSV